MMKRLISLTLSLLVIFSCFSVFAENATREQETALAMLNHLTVLTQETNESKNSRLFLEQAYSEIINNTYPNSVDSRTLSRLTRLLDTMENFRMINVKRERLQYIYEQNQAQAIRSAIPNPLGMLSTVHSLTPARLVASILYMAVDSVSSYESAKSQAELQYLKDGWELDDEEAKELHASQKDMFSYMVNMVNEYAILGDLTLTEELVQEFTKWENDPNIVARIQFLESNQKTYQAFGGYWLLLAESYYNNGELQKCIEAMNSYEAIDVRIYRKDFDYAKALPLAIAASEQVLSTEDYVAYASERAQAIVDNTKNEDWALRYFAAQTYVSLYDKTNDTTFLEAAYQITLDNITNLLHEQNDLNAAFIAPVVETKASKDATNNEKEQVNKYNSMLKETRKTELTPTSEALTLNLDLLFGLADVLCISDTEKTRVDSILHPQGAALFLNKVLDTKYTFFPTENIISDNVEIAFNGTSLAIPVSYVSTDTKIEVSVRENDSNEPLLISDWKLEKVERKKDRDLSTYGAVYTSEEAKKHNWEPNAEILVNLVPDENHETQELCFTYTTATVKTEWYEYVTKAFSGHKNEWYDYLKVWENSVDFTRIYNDHREAN